MALLKASIQKEKSLEEFYGALKESTDAVSSSTGSSMLELLPLLRELCAEVEVWCLTSLARLWLLPGDSPGAPWLVSVQPFPGQGFRISYREVASEAPWPKAEVQGFASNEADAIRMVRNAMQRFGSWCF